MDFGLVIPALIAGFLTFLAPCTLPLVPGYLGFISGTSLQDLKDPLKAPQVKRKIFWNGLAFVIGFSAIFIIMGTLAGLVGIALAPFRIWLARIGGVFIILFGLFMLNVIKIPFLSGEHRIKAPSFFKKRNPLNSFVFGGAFGIGWTPCVGPILGAILLLAGTSGTAFQGSFLLAIFSLGLGIPFLLIAWGIGGASKYIEKFSKLIKAVSVIGGIFLIGLGIIILLNKMPLFLSWSFRLLEFMNYENNLLRFL